MNCFLAALGLFVLVLIETTFARSRYKIFDYNSNIKSWDDARAACQRSGRRWDLVRIDSFEEDLKLKIMLTHEYNSGDGWFIGGRSQNGRWTWADGSEMMSWADGSEMMYQNFPPTYNSVVAGDLLADEMVTVNYAVIFKQDFAWGYVAPRQTSKMGYVCEKTYRSCSDS